jgi:hypothetical protein
VLGNGADAEDVCQAVFLLLAQRADSLCKAEHLGAWLYTVAVNVARNAQSKAARRRMHERQVGVMQRQGDSGEDAWKQVRPILDVEMSRLSEKYRLPLVLCYFGQGALILSDPTAVHNPFYSMVPNGPAKIALVVLAAAATVIASQALISGAFSLTNPTEPARDRSF